MSVEVASETPKPFTGGTTLLGGAAVVGIAGLAGLGTIWGSDQFYYSYLIGYAFTLTIVMGSLIFLMIVHAMGATWPTAIRRLPEAVVSTMPLLAVGVVPIWMGTNNYPWMHLKDFAKFQETLHVLNHKAMYMSENGFRTRAVICVVTWTLFAEYFRRSSLKLDSQSDPALKHQLKVVASVGLPVVGLSFTLAAFDWVMSLSADWASTMFGVYFFAGGFLSSFGLMAINLTLCKRAGFLQSVNDSHVWSIGRLMFAFTVFWAYISFFQFMLIWIANKPAETVWYLLRIQPDYRWVPYTLMLGHFALPFFFLLWYRLKRNLKALTAIAAWNLAMHFIDIHWMIGPMRHWQDHIGTIPKAADAFMWTDFAAVAAVAGLAIAVAVFRQRGKFLAPIKDPLYENALRYDSR